MKAKSIFFIILLFCGLVIGILALEIIGCWFYVENNQWLKSPDVHYDWWHFLFFFNNAFSWLYYHNFNGWLPIAVGYAILFAPIILVLILLEVEL